MIAMKQNSIGNSLDGFEAVKLKSSTVCQTTVVMNKLLIILTVIESLNYLIFNAVKGFCRFGRLSLFINFMFLSSVFFSSKTQNDIHCLGEINNKFFIQRQSQ